MWFLKTRIFAEDSIIMSGGLFITDVVAALTDSIQPGGYLKDMRKRDSELNKGWGQIASPFL